MRKIISILFIFSCLFSFQLKAQNIELKKTIDKNLVGVWKGEEKENQSEGLSKSWVMTRKNDGTFLLVFKVNDNGKINTIKEKGNWWVEDGKFYEFHNTSGLTDVYIYTILSKDKVKFKAVNMAIEQNNENYEFIDERVK